MITALEVISWLLIVAGGIWLTLYVTWLFLVRLRAGDAGFRSFGRWLRDLTDVLFGLG